jgi:hypothetical protein
MNDRTKTTALDVFAARTALYLAPLALVACGHAALPSSAVSTTAARASTDDDSGYGYEFEVDSSKNGGASAASALSLPHAAGDRVPPETIQAIVRARYGALLSCYQAGLEKDPTLTGTVTVRFVAAEDGTTKAAADQGSTLSDKDVVGCVVGELAKLTYPRGGGTMTVVYPIQFAR